MPYRLVIGPVADDPDGGRTSKALTLADPGNPGGTYVGANIISDGVGGQRNDIVVTLVGGLNFSNLDADAEIVTLLPIPDAADIDTFRAIIAQTPNERTVSNGDLVRMRNRLQNLSISTTGLDADTPLFWWANRAGQVCNLGTDVRKLFASLPTP